MSELSQSNIRNLSDLEDDIISSKLDNNDNRSHSLITINKHKNTKLPSIEIRNGFKDYGIFNHWRQVLCGCNLKANNGEIYAILGPHDCGKTTILHLLLGLTRLNNGDVEIFGFNPMNPSSGIPGFRVGFTPQREGLYLEFTIDEILRYYAAILKLKSDYVNERISFLNELLFLPGDEHMLKLYDDNIRRRVSFAISILHEPQLIILDEPTYGVSPAIRKSIWKHLNYLSNEEDKTIIITTQNSMEAEYAHRVGILHEGKIAIEGEPESIVERNGEKSLESIYSRIYMKYDENVDKIIENVRKSLITIPAPVIRRSSSEGFDVTSHSLREFPKTRSKIKNSNYVFGESLAIHIRMCCPSCNAIFLMSWKNMLMVKRNIGLSIYCLLVPLSLLFLFYYGIGHWPHELPVGVFNGEIRQPNECYSKFYSCQILYRINLNIIKLIMFKDLKTLIKNAKNGLLSGYIIFPKGFTNLVRSELSSDIFGDEIKSLRDLAFITISLDATNAINAYEVEKEIRRAECDFFNKVDLDQDSALAADYPLKILEPMFGTTNTTYAEYVGSSLVMCWPTLMAFTIAIGFYKIERERNLHHMTYLIGIKRFDTIFGYIFSFGIILVLYSLLVLIILVNVCNLPAIGSMFYFILLTIVQMIFTTTFGITIAKVCRTWITAASTIIYLTVFCTAISGIVWPTSALPKWLRVFSEALPLTTGIRAGRNILQKGMPLMHITVFPGIYLPLTYCVLNVILILALFKCMPDL